ncbi:uncharacterized protein C8Q71DRAFT_733860 [Rhodofomes roseus]|uniref:Secreted protein n=1 Tax=Rhodofomes roseus TaxID=34475 RepID=A0ABQ8KG37_9APHY|nr:uncharacterized protein C8Q71DRAFT_759568 [Rhodofomes roseus]XP_047783714.1 uncharacterized protein C8Q71DRAFT_733860 [Rhodofomes roseus]KAH9836754.1 hypothetical protein C8Q71DRAFT_759568 [Rhodofomes roseus]KAH9842667.1 hypothetical protein C8Q71DRAFT_733860 [Rhodofomes roseus]
MRARLVVVSALVANTAARVRTFCSHSNTPYTCTRPRASRSYSCVSCSHYGRARVVLVVALVPATAGCTCSPLAHIARAVLACVCCVRGRTGSENTPSLESQLKCKWATGT